MFLTKQQTILVIQHGFLHLVGTQFERFRSHLLASALSTRSPQECSILKLFTLSETQEPFHCISLALIGIKSAGLRNSWVKCMLRLSSSVGSQRIVAPGWRGLIPSSHAALHRSACRARGTGWGLWWHPERVMDPAQLGARLGVADARACALASEYWRRARAMSSRRQEVCMRRLS
jgi:hypothetical protein